MTSARPARQARRVNHHSVSASPGNQSPARLTGRGGAAADSGRKQTLRRRAVAAGRRRSTLRAAAAGANIFEQAQLLAPVAGDVAVGPDERGASVQPSGDVGEAVTDWPPSSGRSRRRRRCWQHLRFPFAGHMRGVHKLPARIEAGSGSSHCIGAHTGHTLAPQLSHLLRDVNMDGALGATDQSRNRRFTGGAQRMDCHAGVQWRPVTDASPGAFGDAALRIEHPVGAGGKPALIVPQSGCGKPARS